MSIRRSGARLVRSFESGPICAPCAQRLLRRNVRSTLRYASSSTTAQLKPTWSHGTLFYQKYFQSNHILAGTGTRDAVNQQGSPSSLSNAIRQANSERAQALQSSDTLAAIPGPADPTLPHRRRKWKREHGPDTPEAIPADASSQLSRMSSDAPRNSLKQRFFTYLALSKPRLTFLVVLTTTSAYTLFPVAVSPMSASLTLSPMTLFNLTAGTALASGCANALNMIMEPEHDAKMTRTRNRPLVRGLLSKRAALVFALLTGAGGVALLNFGVNPTVAFLGALNIALYAGCYTPLKRISVINTWVGAIVGGIPPLMGWAAAAGQATPYQDAGWRDLLFDPQTSAGGWLLATLLFAWQFPHFNALSYTIRHEYAAAGYRMLASINPRKNAAIALRYSVLMLPVCVALSTTGVTSWAYAPISVAVNTWVVREAWRFYRHQGAKGTSRTLFWASVWQLPLLLILAMVLKSGMWERLIWGGLDGEAWEDAMREPAVETEQRDDRDEKSVQKE